MARPVAVINEISRVRTVYEVLKATEHNAFPVLNKDGHLRGLILRKALCSLLKYKTFSFPMGREEGGGTQLTSASTMFHDTMERNYPHYPQIDDIKLLPSELV
jgi:CBS-domain-containing membrane protein